VRPRAHSIEAGIPALDDRATGMGLAAGIVVVVLVLVAVLTALLARPRL
jgi:hypothetical protein